MTTALTLPDDLFREVESRAEQEGSNLNDTVTALLRIGLAKTALLSSLTNDSMLQRRMELTQKFISGEWGVEFAGYEESRPVENRKTAERANAWRE